MPPSRIPQRRARHGFAGAGHWRLELVSTWQDARLFAALAGAVAHFWRRRVLLTLVVGMAVDLPLHLRLSW